MKNFHKHKNNLFFRQNPNEYDIRQCIESVNRFRQFTICFSSICSFTRHFQQLTRIELLAHFLFHWCAARTEKNSAHQR